jgi:serine/threonine protein kinase
MANKSRLSNSGHQQNPNPNGKKKARLLTAEEEANKHRHQQVIDGLALNYDDSLCSPLVEGVRWDPNVCISSVQGKPIAVYRGITITSPDELALPNQQIILYEKVGSGSFADVYKASYNGQTVAVKILKSAEHSKQACAFYRELAGLKETRSCCHTLDLIGYRPAPDFWIITNFMTGGTLHSVLKERNGPLEFEEVLELALQLCSCMRELHGMCPPLMHRDLSPYNIMFDQNGQLKLGDFGVAVTLPEAYVDYHVHSFDLSVNGHPYYRAPEVERKQPYGLRAEVYSFGSILFECMTGYLFTNEIVAVEPEKRVEALLFASMQRADTWLALWKLIANCWGVDPLQRPTFADIFEGLVILRDTLLK